MLIMGIIHQLSKKIIAVVTADGEVMEKMVLFDKKGKKLKEVTIQISATLKNLSIYNFNFRNETN